MLIEPSRYRSHPCPARFWAKGGHPMSLVWRLLAVMALSAMPMSSGLAAASSPSAPGNGSSGAHGVHKGTPRAGMGPAKASESPGPGTPGIARGQPMIGLGKSSLKPPSALRIFNGQGLNGPAVKGPGLGPHGDLSERGTGSPRGTATNSGIPGVRTQQRGGTNPLVGAGPSISGGLPRRPAEINGSTMGARGLAAAKIAPSPKANTSINGTGLGRRN
jgi:hypothetical protein